MLEPSNISNTHWSTSRKFIFLFVVSYTFLYIFPFPIDAFPQLSFIFNHYESLTNKFVIFIWEHILHLHNCRKLAFSDSGDTTLDFAKFFLFLFLSSISAIAILLIDKKRNNYQKIQSYLFIYIRYCIGFYMLVYGFDKIFKSHFPFPSLEKLEQPFGESSPQGLLWAFMGYSTSYTVYLGIIEVLSGFLLLFRRTTALGSVLVLLIMINVTVINFSYDVPVKLFALHMVAYSLILLYPFFNTVFQFFILQKESKLPKQSDIVFPKIIQRYRKIIKAVIIISFTALFMNFSITNMRTDGDNAPKPLLYGIYKSSGLEIFPTIINNKTIFNTIDEIIFDTKNTVIKYSIINSSIPRDINALTSVNINYYDTKTDTINKIIYFQSNSNPLEKFQFGYTLENNNLMLTKNDSTVIGFRKVDQKKFPLINHGFHWVVEYPDNN